MEGGNGEGHGGGLPLPKIPALRFESRFECGNLSRALRIGPAEYELIMSSDLNTDGNTQWFYFGVDGIRHDVE